MNYFTTYLIAFVVFLTLALGFFVPAFVIKDSSRLSKYQSIYQKVSGAVGVAFFFLLLFFVQNVMTTSAAPGNRFNESVGCVHLIGEPYGDNTVANFFAWFSIPLFLSSIAITVFFALFQHRIGHFLTRFVALPNLCLSFAFSFHLSNTFFGVNVFSYKSAIFAIALGFALALSLIQSFAHKEERHFKIKEIFYALGIFLLIWISFLPTSTFAVLLDTNVSLFGSQQTFYEVYDFKVMHRYYLYLGLAYYIALYFAIRNQEQPFIRAVLLSVCFGAIASFFTSYGFDAIFDLTNHSINVTNLPIHLCHTALFILPLCVGFKFKRLFYFTYFINVFGAAMAIIWPNVGEDLNMYSPDVILFWYNHLAALFMPLLCVMLKIFDRPKMKQMFFSLLFFTVYFVLILFANAFLSCLVPGYNPNVIGSGTDYLFINGTYILDIISDQAYHMMDVKWVFPFNNTEAVIYPLYQGVFYLGYTAIAFAMWFVYALFYKIEDSHLDLRNKYKIAKLNHISWKEKRKMDELNQTEINHAEAKLEFIDFSKRYLNSSKLSADHVNLCVKGGEIFGYLGPNGAGKSTCIKTAIGIQPVTEGAIKVCGYDVSEEPVKAKRCIGYVPDHYALYEKLTGREYINYIADLYGVSKEDRDQRIAYYVDLFELNHSFDARMQTYSHGMKQKIAIIAALVHEPKVWILDEPLTGLDPQSIFQVKKTMLHHAEKGNVVFFSSHIIDVVERLCSRIAVIKKGQIVYQGTMEETLKKHPEGLERFYLSLIEEEEDEE